MFNFIEIPYLRTGDTKAVILSCGDVAYSVIFLSDGTVMSAQSE